MRFPEYDSLDATGLAELLHKGDVTPGEVLEAAVERIEARNPALNAVVHGLYDRARERLPDLPKGPLWGVPFLLKDLKIQLQGTATTNSTRLGLTHRAQSSSVLAERYEQAGLQLLGKTNTPEFGIMGITEPRLRGPCRNPWDHDHSPGGSSGGSAAAVAARMVPAAHGGDGGGSIRIPASSCGLFGLKPTRGRVSMAPFAGEAWGGLVQEHALTRSVRDSALLLDIADVYTPGEPYGVPAKARPWSDEVGRPPGRLRIAVSRDTLYAGTTHPDCAAAVDDGVAVLRDLGHEVVEATPPFPRDAMVRAYYLAVGAGVANFVETTARQAGCPVRAADYEPATWVMALVGWKTTAAELVASQQVVHQATREIGRFFEEHDLFLSSTTAQPPARIGQLTPSEGELLQLQGLRRLPLKRLLNRAITSIADKKLAWTPNTQLFNQTGQPAMSVPLAEGSTGMPVGIQFAAPFGGEATLFRLAAQLEEARPWAGRKPPSVA